MHVLLFRETTAVCPASWQRKLLCSLSGEQLYCYKVKSCILHSYVTRLPLLGARQLRVFLRWKGELSGPPVRTNFYWSKAAPVCCRKAANVVSCAATVAAALCPLPICVSDNTHCLLGMLCAVAEAVKAASDRSKEIQSSSSRLDDQKRYVG